MVGVTRKWLDRAGGRIRQLCDHQRKNIVKTQVPKSQAPPQTSPMKFEDQITTIFLFSGLIHVIAQRARTVTIQTLFVVSC